MGGPRQPSRWAKCSKACLSCAGLSAELPLAHGLRTRAPQHRPRARVGTGAGAAAGLPGSGHPSGERQEHPALRPCSLWRQHGVGLYRCLHCRAGDEREFGPVFIGGGGAASAGSAQHWGPGGDGSQGRVGADRLGIHRSRRALRLAFCRNHRRRLGRRAPCAGCPRRRFSGGRREKRSGDLVFRGRLGGALGHTAHQGAKEDLQPQPPERCRRGF
mmetsp:Transcript_160446/g.514998  ORF Transcript_160446/g.514998 Transcript_160446/m.514998 type:complete len:216 (-) Transcript_160446:82-729(-)